MASRDRDLRTRGFRDRFCSPGHLEGRAGATERLDELDADRHVLAYSVTESVRPATVGLSARITLTETEDGSTAVEWVVSPPESDGLTDEMIDGMRSYYPTRIQNLGDAVERKAEHN